MADSKNAYGVLLFCTGSAAFRAEKILTKEGLKSKLIPIPREFSSDCGTALRFEWDHSEQVQKLLESARVKISSIQRLP
jgi:hypothetical protein